MDMYLDEELARLRTDYIDFYLVNGLNRQFWENLSVLALRNFLTKQWPMGGSAMPVSHSMTTRSYSRRS